MYRGAVYYFDGGNGKSDDRAYALAVQSWELLKSQLDAEASTAKPHRAAYEAAIGDWEAVQSWAIEQDDAPVRAAAAIKLASLRARLAQRVPPPLTHRDQATRRDQLSYSPLLDRVAEELHPNSPKVSEGDVEAFGERVGIAVEEIDDGRLGDLLNRLVNNTVWKDRLQNQRQKADSVAPQQTVSHQIAEYVAIRARSGITAGASDNIRRHLQFFQEFVGAATSVADIGPKTLDTFHGHVVSQIANLAIAAESGRNSLQAARAWIRWLWQQTLITELPRNINSPSHRIRPELKSVQTLTAAEVKQLYTAAKPNLQLYILLAINCGMTQVDIADLRPDQVDFAAGTLTRKRSKTQHNATVPTVTYPLWPETLKLLNQERSGDAQRLLLAPGGGPLKFEARKGDKTAKHDYIGLSFRRLAARLKIAAPFKTLKKTSASFLRNHGSYIGLEGLFLDHAPRNVSDRHYAAVPKELFAEAVKWLHEQYGPSLQPEKR